MEGTGEFRERVFEKCSVEKCRGEKYEERREVWRRGEKRKEEEMNRWPFKSEANLVLASVSHSLFLHDVISSP